MAFEYTSSTTITVTEDPSTPALGSFVSVYDNAGVFSADIQYFDDTIPEVKTIQPITLSSYNYPIQGFTVSQKDVNTLTISGTAHNVIQGGEFRFLMPDRSIQILPPDTELEYDALIGWKPPSIKMVQVSHSLDINVNAGLPGSSVQTLTIIQEVYWKLQFGLQAFQLALSKGKL